MCNQIGKSTENILMHCTRKRSSDAVLRGEQFNDEFRRTTATDTHIKTRGVLYMLWKKNNIKSNTNRSEYIVFQANEHWQNIYAKHLITMGKESGAAGRAAKAEKSGTRLFWTRLFLFVRVSSITHLFYSLFFFLFSRPKSCFMPKFCCSVFFCCCCYWFCCCWCSCYWNVEKAASCC